MRFKPNLITFLASALIAALMMSAGCKSKNASRMGAAGPPPAVVVVAALQRTVPIYSEFVGQTRAIETVELRARVEGLLEKIYFKQGSPVKKGDLLIAIDRRPFEAALQSAKAALAKAESDFAQAKQRTDVFKAQAELADAEAVLSRSEQDLARVRPLAKANAVAELELDAAVAAQKSAKANVDARQANLTNLEASVKYTIERATAEVLAAKARLIQSELDLSYCSIYSPISGVIGFKQVDEGNLVGRGDATLLATVSTPDPLLVDFNLSETEYLRLIHQKTVGRRVDRLRFELILSDDSVHPYPGTFRVADRTVDPSTGALKVETSFPNPKRDLRPGQFAHIRVAVAEQENAILVPQQAVQELQGAKTILVVDANNVASVRTIVLGDRFENYFIVIEGLIAGERVIVEGIQKVRPGGEVNPSSTPGEAKSAGVPQGT
jgi:membrane fusion protein, multidrug efflux system